MVKAYACSKEAAKTLMQAVLFGDNVDASFAQWKKEHGVAQGALLHEVRELNTQVLAFHGWAFADSLHVFGIARKRVRERQPQWSDRKLDRSLFASWLFDAEDEVLVLIGKALVRLSWAVDALIFDELLIGGGTAADGSGERLQADLRKVERALESEGWRVALDVKPRRGAQDAPVPTIGEARAAVAAFEAC